MRWLACLFLAAAAIVVNPAAQASQEVCTIVTTSKFIAGKSHTYRKRVCFPVAESGGGDAVEPLDPERTEFDYNAFVEECTRQAVRIAVDPRTFCLAGDEAQQPLTAPQVESAFANLPLPPSRLVVQPPNGRTLVNFETNFYTERPAFTRVVTLLGQRVTLRIEPESFTWYFAEGEARTTTTPGAPYPHLLVTHNYLARGDYHPRVDTTYTATFRVGNGPWRPVPGSVTIAGPTVALEAVEARPVLTAP